MLYNTVTTYDAPFKKHCGKILEKSKLKAFADDKLNEYYEIKIRYCGKRRKCLLLVYSPSPTLFFNKQVGGYTGVTLSVCQSMRHEILSGA